MPRKESFEPIAFECDRRLSRAARELLQRRILPLLPHSHKDDVEILKEAITNQSTCILHPDRDVLWIDEEHSKRIPAGPQRWAPRRHARHWYECGYCGKTFLTRYYLDVHLETTHGLTISDTDVCPADLYCQALGGCHHVALELEPYYGRGSGGVGPDALQVRQMWSRQLKPCNEVVMWEQLQPRCRQVMRDCFAPEVADDLVASVCDTMTCRHRLHQLAGHVVQHVHSWKHVWEHHSNHNVGWVGFVVVLVLVVYYTIAFNRKQTMKPTSRLLSKKSTSPSKWKLLAGSSSKSKLH